jgi:hypothetical protein
VSLAWYGSSQSAFDLKKRGLGTAVRQGQRSESGRRAPAGRGLEAAGPGTTDEFCTQFAKLPMADPTTHTLALYCFSVSSRDEVDTVSAAALAAGGSEADDAEDYGFMYSRSFFDLDGHGWQVMWMDPAAAEQGPEAFAASMQDAEARA